MIVVGERNEDQCDYLPCGLVTFSKADPRSFNDDLIARVTRLSCLNVMSAAGLS